MYADHAHQQSFLHFPWQHGCIWEELTSKISDHSHLVVMVNKCQACRDECSGHTEPSHYERSAISAAIFMDVIAVGEGDERKRRKSVQCTCMCTEIITKLFLRDNDLNCE